MLISKVQSFVFSKFFVNYSKNLRCLYGVNSNSFSESKKKSHKEFWKDFSVQQLGVSYTHHSRGLRSDGSNHVSEKVLSEQTNNMAFKMVRSCPESVQPYLRLMRIDRPIGTWLVFLPCAWSLSLASGPGVLPDAKMLLLFGLGSFFMRGAGCTINDMWDKDFDSKVARTKMRPLASGEVTRFKALCFLSIPLSISLSILLTFNWNTVVLGVCSMVPCIFYPLAKRFTYWPQLFLGLIFNWGVVMGWCAETGSVSWPVLPLYLSSIAWTLFYDTLYAFQDIEDDLKVGVKSTAIRFGEHTKQWLAAFNALSTGSLLTTGYLLQQNFIYYAAVCIFSAHLTHQVVTVDLGSRQQCAEKFRSNRDIGLFLLVCLLASTLYTRQHLEPPSGQVGAASNEEIVLS